jgi:hypothetical protein
MAAFVAQWREIDQPTVDGGEWSHHRIGVVSSTTSSRRSRGKL